MVLYYMLTGEPAFGARAVNNTWQDMPFDAHIQQIQAGPRLQDHPVFSGPEGAHVSHLLRSLLAFNPHHRPSIEQLRSPQFFPWFAEGLPAAHNPSGQEQGPQALRPVRFERVKSALTSVVEDARKILMNQAAQPQGMMMVQ
jgi:serine/threonine protein kinase